MWVTHMDAEINVLNLSTCSYDIYVQESGRQVVSASQGYGMRMSNSYEKSIDREILV